MGKDNKIAVVMTAKSWQAASDAGLAEVTIEDIPRMVRQLEKKTEGVDVVLKRIELQVQEAFRGIDLSLLERSTLRCSDTLDESTMMDVDRTSLDNALSQYVENQHAF